MLKAIFQKGNSLLSLDFPVSKRIVTEPSKGFLYLTITHTTLMEFISNDNAGDAKLFKRKNSTCYVPDKQFGFSVGLGWAANSSKGNKCKANCVLKKIRTYPLCPHILCTDMRFNGIPCIGSNSRHFGRRGDSPCLQS